MMMPRFRSIRAFFAIFGVILSFSCSQPDVDNSSFGLIQSKILTPGCAISGCHSGEADNTFSQHRLVLEKSVSYSNLVNASPANANALADNLLRVKSSNAEESLLFHKLHSDPDHHSHDYGNPMPLGLPAISEGQLEFIRLWIEAGAPQNGSVADASLLDDTTPQPEIFEPLAPPGIGKGYQVSLPEFSVAPNFEREFFVYKKLGNTETIYVNRFEIKMRRNSHHFILYDFDSDIPPSIKPTEDVVRDIRNTNGSLNILNLQPMAYHTFIMGSQTPYLNYSFPEGVAIAFPAGAMADFNSHYVNKQSAEIPGEVYVNLHTTEVGKVTKVAKALNLPNTDIRLAANQRTTLTKNFLFDKEVSILSITSHTHQLAEKFVVKIKGGSRNGETVYTNNDWHHPGFTSYNPPIVLRPGEGLTSEITYNNTKTRTVTFGLTSEDEMGIIFGYYFEN